MNASSFFRRFVRDTRGANMVEYIILVGMVALICIAAFGKFSGSVKKKLGDQGAQVESGINSGRE